MTILDTNPIIRYFRDDVPEQRKRVEQLFNSKEELFIPDVVFGELEYVFQKQYSISKEQFLQIAQFLLSLPQVQVSLQMGRALQLYEGVSLSIVDCIVIEQARGQKLASFDRKLLRHCHSPYWE